MTPALAPPVIADVDAAAALFAPLAGSPFERAAVAYLDPNRRLLGRSDFQGGADRIAPPLRVIVAAALRLDATGLILVHTHPSGDARPSAADLAYTRRLAQVAEALDLTLIDHLILAGGHVTSLRDRGLL